MNHELNRRAERRRRDILLLLYGIATEWATVDYVRKRVACSKQQARRDIELLEGEGLAECCQVIDVRNEGVGISDETIESPRTSRALIVKLTHKGRKKAGRIPAWVSNI